MARVRASSSGRAALATLLARWARAPSSIAAGPSWYGRRARAYHQPLVFQREQQPEGGGFTEPELPGEIREAPFRACVGKRAEDAQRADYGLRAGDLPDRRRFGMAFHGTSNVRDGAAPVKARGRPLASAFRSRDRGPRWWAGPSWGCGMRAQESAPATGSRLDWPALALPVGRGVSSNSRPLLQTEEGPSVPRQRRQRLARPAAMAFLYSGWSVMETQLPEARWKMRDSGPTTPRRMADPRASGDSYSAPDRLRFRSDTWGFS